MVLQLLYKNSFNWIPFPKHCDETPVQVLKEEGKKPQTKSYMWLYRTGNDDKAPVI